MITLVKNMGKDPILERARENTATPTACVLPARLKPSIGLRTGLWRHLRSRSKYTGQLWCEDNPQTTKKLHRCPRASPPSSNILTRLMDASAWQGSMPQSQAGDHQSSRGCKSLYPQILAALPALALTGSSIRALLQWGEIKCAWQQ